MNHNFNDYIDSRFNNRINYRFLNSTYNKDKKLEPIKIIKKQTDCKIVSVILVKYKIQYNKLIN